MFRSTFHNLVVTPIPDDVDPQTIIQLVHDHKFLITMSPIVTRHSERHREGQKVTYDVWENINVLPFGWWKHEIHFSSAFEDQRDGLVSWIKAPMGLVSRAKYTVRHTKEEDLKLDEEGEMSKWVIEESIESECSVFFKLFVEMTMVPVRRKMHFSVIEKAREQSGGSDKTVQQWLHPR